MSQAIEQLEKQQSKLDKDNKRLNDTNEMLLEITKKQRLMIGTSEQSKGTTSSEDITNKYRASLYKKFADLEKHLLENKTAFTDDFNFDEKDAKQMLKLKVQIHSLLEENKTLKDQLSDFQNLYDQIMAQIRSKNRKNASSDTSDDQQQGKSAICSSPTRTGSLDKDDLQPLEIMAEIQSNAGKTSDNQQQGKSEVCSSPTSTGSFDSDDSPRLQIITEIQSNAGETSGNQQQGKSAICSSPTSTGSFDSDDSPPLQVNVIDSDVDELKDK